MLDELFCQRRVGNSDENFAFELCSGSLVCNLKGHKKSAAELDGLCVTAAAVVRRLAEEAAERGAPDPAVPRR